MASGRLHIGHMNRFALLLCLALPVPALAEDAPAPPKDEGFSLMEEGAKLLFRGLMQEMEPALDGMGDAVKQIEPRIRELVALIDDIRNYEAPRMLENGDILIPRRKVTPPLVPPLPGPAQPGPAQPGPNGEIEL